MTHLACAVLLALAQNDKTQANAYDDAWENGWVTHCRTVLQGGSGKTTGFVLLIGDSITYSNPNTQWLRYGAGQTPEDSGITGWAMFSNPFPGSPNDPTDKNGAYLAATDVPGANRSMTAASGLSTDEFLTGNGNGGTAMPSTTVTSTAQSYVSNGTYTGNIHVTSLAAAFADAQFAVLMLGTNDCSAGRAASAFIADLTSIVNTLEGRNIVVILSTIPPHFSNDALAQSYNASIRSFAQSRGLPLIDYYQEILTRRPGTSWNGTLMGLDDVHPSATNSSGDPYSPGGNPAIHQTGDNCLDGGYLLRGWLTAQKLKEAKSYVVDGNNPGGGGPPPPGPGPGPGPGPAPSGSNSDSDEGTCGCEAVASADRPILALVLALLVIMGLPRRPVLRSPKS